MIDLHKFAVGVLKAIEAGEPTSWSQYESIGGHIGYSTIVAETVRVAVSAESPGYDQHSHPKVFVEIGIYRHVSTETDPVFRMVDESGDFDTFAALAYQQAVEQVHGSRIAEAAKTLGISMGEDQ